MQLPRKYNFLLWLYLIVFGAMLVVSILLLWSQSKEVENMSSVYGSSYEITVASTVDSKNLRACKSVAENTLNEFKPYLGSLEKVVIHTDTSLRRGMANDKLLYIRCLPDLEEFLNVLVHEIGHVVDLGYLKNDDFKFASNDSSTFKNFAIAIPLNDISLEFYNISWTSSELKNKRSIKNDFVSEYAASDPFEDFAESFLMYVRYPETFLSYAKGNPNMRKKYNFLRDEVFEQKEFLADYNIELMSMNLDSEQNRVYDATRIHKNI